MLEADNLSARDPGRGRAAAGPRDSIGQARAIAALYDAADRGLAVAPD